MISKILSHWSFSSLTIAVIMSNPPYISMYSKPIFLYRKSRRHTMCFPLFHLEYSILDNSNLIPYTSNSTSCGIMVLFSPSDPPQIVKAIL